MSNLRSTRILSYASRLAGLGRPLTALWAAVRQRRRDDEVERRDAEVLRLRVLLSQLEADVSDVRRLVAEAERRAASMRRD